VLGDRPAAVGRELTKRHEEMRRGSLAALAAHYRSGPPRGEVVVVVGPPGAAETERAAGDLDALLDTSLGRLSLRDAVACVAAETGLGRRAIYERALARQRRSKAR
jgi:16S rRNA (cytidine1402-2'-O)-methyltransferase